MDKFRSVESASDVSLLLVADVLLREPIFAGVATPAAALDLVLDCLNRQLVDVNYPDGRVASRRNVTRRIDVVFPVLVFQSGSNGNWLRRACRNERGARLEASPARPPMLPHCLRVGCRGCRFE